ncbi:hypothetical protein IFM89_001307 [Coptis chinensis]|uniref:Uncharacterized protein n=1 Tax=Coptis chinensis TaxID=261450 RepID=A0A835IW71_9MAGN|nr:hypothetical protein IFM89_001307 [Coptis chinensis]
MFLAAMSSSGQRKFYFWQQCHRVKVKENPVLGSNFEFRSKKILQCRVQVKENHVLDSNVEFRSKKILFLAAMSSSAMSSSDQRKSCSWQQCQVQVKKSCSWQQCRVQVKENPVLGNNVEFSNVEFRSKKILFLAAMSSSGEKILFLAAMSSSGQRKSCSW